MDNQDVSSSLSRISAASLAMNERNDCVVCAVALASGEPYEVIHRMLAAKGRRRRCRTFGQQWKPVLEQLGFELIDVRGWFDARTARTLRAELPVRGTFLIRVTGHIFCVREGVWADWSAGTCKRVTNVWRVRKKS